MSAVAQCWGKDNVLAMFENRKVQAWSILCGRQFLFTGIGEDELEEMLTMIEGGMNSLYTLKVYRGVTNAEEITEKTAAAGSFNFYIKERQQQFDGQQGNY